MCDLQSQGLSYSCIWDWGALDKLKHLPRVFYKNIIIKKARWNIKKEDLIKEKQKIINQSQLDTFIEEYRIPQFVCFVEGDNELLIDLKNHISLTILSEYLIKNKSIIIQEFLFTKQNCIVSDVNGKKYTNEIIIPNIKNINPKIESVRLNHFNTSLGKISKYSINSEWLYFKIYCGNTSAETLLSGVIHNFINLGIENELFESFFFIRYKDESSHLRLRFYNKDLKKQQLIFTQFNDALEMPLSQGIVSKVILDSYQRELTRYSERYIEFVETYFYFDSKCVVNFLYLLEGTNTVKYRLLFALIGIDFILDDFGYSIDEKQSLIYELKNSFFIEFGESAILQKQLNSKYRNYQKDIFSHMNRNNDEINEICEPLALFINRSVETKQLIKEFFGSINPTESREYFNTVVPSIIHMYMNRLYVSRHRNHEMVIYFFLEKYYSSIIAINKLNTTSKDSI
jgi:thiopeptide-type bacteriocin biosynthesis protein